MLNHLYKLFIHDVTDHCYSNCLDFFSANARVLDVGIGNGVMIKKYHHLIKSKTLHITGIDINRHYLDHCGGLIRSYELQDHIDITCEPVEVYEPPRRQYFDYILFSMSFMLLQDQKLVLDRIRDWLRPGGKIVFFQTMFKERFPLMEFIKPKLKYFTTVDFGKVTYEGDFYRLLDDKRLQVSEDRLIKREWFKGEYRIIISAPENGKPKSASALRPPPPTA